MRKLAEQFGDELRATNGNFVVPNHLTEVQVVEDHEDTTHSPVEFRIFDISTEDGLVLASNGVTLIERYTLNVEDPKTLANLVKMSEQALRLLRPDCYEIWGAGHNVNDYESGGFHCADDEDGPVNMLLTSLRDELVAAGHPVTPTPYNHDKVSVKKQPVTRVTGTHVDSFEGMRVGQDGKRLKIYRHFLNMSLNPRYTLLAPLHPDDVSSVVPLEYSESFLDPLFEAVDDRMHMLRVGLRPADYKRGIIQGFKTTTTHLPHAEYGLPGDTLAVIDTLDY
jgi:hypothetical protein